MPRKQRERQCVSIIIKSLGFADRWEIPKSELTCVSRGVRTAKSQIVWKAFLPTLHISE